MRKFSAFVKRALKIRKDHLAEAFDAIFSQSLVEMEQIKNMFSGCKDILEGLFSHVRERDEIKEILNEYMQSYKERGLADFQCPAQLQTLSEAIKIIGIWGKSELLEKHLSMSSE